MAFCRRGHVELNLCWDQSAHLLEVLVSFPTEVYRLVVKLALERELRQMLSLDFNLGVHLLWML